MGRRRRRFRAPCAVSAFAVGTRDRTPSSCTSGTRHARSETGRTGGCFERRRAASTSRPCAAASSSLRPPPIRSRPRTEVSDARSAGRPLERGRARCGPDGHRCCPSFRDTRSPELLARRARHRVAPAHGLRRPAPGDPRERGDAVSLLRARLAMVAPLRLRRSRSPLAVGARRSRNRPRGVRRRDGIGLAPDGARRRGARDVHPFLVWYSQEARAYGLFALLAAVGLFFFGQALRAGGHWAFVGWAIASSLALATHYFAVFLIVPEAVWLLLRSPARRVALLATVLLRRPPRPPATRARPTGSG